MTLKAGDEAPDFTLPDDHGHHAPSATLAQGPVVLFFYPAASTSGCTVDACHFRDLASEFRALGAQRLRIGVDNVEAPKAFTGANGFDCPFLSDVGGVVAKQFGVKRGALMGKLAPARRATFVIAGAGLVTEVITSETKMGVHADRSGTTRTSPGWSQTTNSPPAAETELKSSASAQSFAIRARPNVE